jgi:two-component system, OmpR family, response regulator
MIHKRRILLVDDDDAHLVSTKGILEDAGFEVFTQRNALGTTNLIKTLQPDLVLLDVNMPGLPGDKLSAIVKSHSATRNVRILYYSSNDEDTLRKAVLETGVDGYVSKGSPAQLRSKIASTLSK